MGHPILEYANMLKDRKAIITGGMSSIGQAVVGLFASQGAKTAIIDGDLSNADDVVSKCQKAIDELGGYADILVCVADCRQPESIGLTEFNKMFDICVTSAILCAKTVIPGMLGQRRGNIIIITHDLALSSMPGTAEVAACSGALLAFSKNVAIEYIRYHVKSNCVLIPYGDSHSSLLGKPEPNDIANAALWYACDISRNITGDFIPVNGGMNYFEPSAAKGGGIKC